MESTTKTTAKDFFINLGAIIALGVVVTNLINLLFTVINKAYPQILNNYYYGSTSYSISFPVASLIIFFPIYILLMWLLERDYKVVPEKRHLGVRKWLTYITLFLAGLAIAGDLVTVIYYFIDGQELTAGFIMKVASVLVIALAIFFYYISDVMDKLNTMSRKVWTGVACFIILASVVWGFSVLGSPRTQQLLKYDEQKVSDLQNINSEIQNYYMDKGVLPSSLDVFPVCQSVGCGSEFLDKQTNQRYEYSVVGQNSKSYNLCAVFNNPSPADLYAGVEVPPYNGQSWTHPVGHFCFTENILSVPTGSPKGVPVPYTN